MTGPVVLAVLAVVAALVVAVGGGPQRRATPATSRARRAGWAKRVRGELDGAWRRVPLGPPAAGGQPLVHGDGGPLEGGWRWRVSTPGSVTVADLEGKSSALASALNSRGPLVGALEVRRDRSHEGWCSVSVWERDPLDDDRDVPWAPGLAAPCVPPGTICAGVGRDGAHVHVPIVVGAGALCSLMAGRRGSGKSVAMVGWLAQMAAWGWVDLVLIDLVRNGTDFVCLEPVAAAPVITSLKDAVTAIRATRAECDRRTRVMATVGARCLTEFNAEVPMIVVAVDEVQALTADPKAGDLLTRLAQEGRAAGCAVMCATQYPTVETLGSTLRMQLALRCAFRCSNAVESGVILGRSSEGVGAHLITTGPGSCVADLDTGGLLSMRSWGYPDAWLADHVGRLT